MFTKHFDDLAQDCSISSALAMEILQSCAKPLKFCKSEDEISVKLKYMCTKYT